MEVGDSMWVYEGGEDGGGRERGGRERERTKFLEEFRVSQVIGFSVA